MSYKERLQILCLTTLEQRRERGDLIPVYRVIKGLQKLGRENLLIWNTRDTRGHKTKLKKDNGRRDINKFSLLQGCVEAWNGLEKGIVHAGTVHAFMAKLNTYRYGDGTARA